jgi:hypothetical protein
MMTPRTKLGRLGDSLVPLFLHIGEAATHGSHVARATAAAVAAPAAAVAAVAASSAGVTAACAGAVAILRLGAAAAAAGARLPARTVLRLWLRLRLRRLAASATTSRRRSRHVMPARNRRRSARAVFPARRRVAAALRRRRIATRSAARRHVTAHARRRRGFAAALQLLHAVALRRWQILDRARPCAAGARDVAMTSAPHLMACHVSSSCNDARGWTTLTVTTLICRRVTNALARNTGAGLRMTTTKFCASASVGKMQRYCTITTVVNCTFTMTTNATSICRGGRIRPSHRLRRVRFVHLRAWK